MRVPPVIDRTDVTRSGTAARATAAVVASAALALAVLAGVGLGGCSSRQEGTPNVEASQAEKSEVSVQGQGQGAATDAAAATIALDVAGRHLSVALAETEAASSLVERLREGPVTLSLRPYGGFERVGALPWALPASDEELRAEPCDVMLYQGNQICVFTGSNSWAYTRLGRVEGVSADELAQALGEADVEVTLRVP
jgi:hypothetical protein